MTTKTITAMHIDGMTKFTNLRRKLFNCLRTFNFPIQLSAMICGSFADLLKFLVMHSSTIQFTLDVEHQDKLDVIINLKGKFKKEYINQELLEKISFIDSQIDEGLVKIKLTRVMGSFEANLIETMLNSAKNIFNEKTHDEIIETLYLETKNKNELLSAQTDELMTYRKELKKALAMKDEFLSIVSHELRTPLNAIIGFSEIVEEEITEIDKIEIQELNKKVLVSANSLLTIVDDILDFMKIEKNKLKINLQKINSKEYFNQLTQYLEQVTSCYESTLIIHVDDDDFSFLSDPSRLNQCLMNIIANAEKHAKTDTITLTIGRDQSKDNIIFRIEDRGIGIANQQINNIFETFFRIDSSTKGSGGIGLGLSTTKSIIELLDGELSLKSKAGEGSSFQIKIPIATAS